MTASRSEQLVHALRKCVNHVFRHKGLARSGKAAAVNTERAFPLQQLIAQSQGNRHLLMLIRAKRNDVLQIHPGGSAGFLYQLEETGGLSLLQRLHLLRNTVIVSIEMNASQHGPVPEFLARPVSPTLNDLTKAVDRAPLQAEYAGSSLLVPEARSGIRRQLDDSKERIVSTVAY